MKISRIHSFKKDKDARRIYKVTTTFDFAGVTPEAIAEWSVNYLVINRTRVYRTWTDEKLVELEKSGSTVNASEAGKGATVDVAKAFVSKFSTLDRKAQDDYIKMLDELRKQGKGVGDIEASDSDETDEMPELEDKDEAIEA